MHIYVSQKITFIVLYCISEGLCCLSFQDKEVSYGAHAPRILALDDYFLMEVEKSEQDPETGKKVKKKVRMELMYDLQNVWKWDGTSPFKDPWGVKLVPFCKKFLHQLICCKWISSAVTVCWFTFIFASSLLSEFPWQHLKFICNLELCFHFVSQTEKGWQWSYKPTVSKICKAWQLNTVDRVTSVLALHPQLPTHI